MVDKEIMVSICCITYNHEKYIKDAIEGFLMQNTDFNYEIIIHDDASTDNTVSIIEEYKRKYPNIIKTIYQKENQYSKNRRMFPIVTKLAKGKYIAICEGDDYWTSCNKLQQQVDYLESNPECTLCFHSYTIVDKDKKDIKVVNNYMKSCKAPVKDMIIKGGGFCATASFMFPKYLMKSLPQYYLKCPVEDYPLQLYCTSKGYAYYINKNMSAYRTNLEHSWNGKINNLESNLKIKKLIEHYTDMIIMLESFNKETKYLYKDYVAEKIFNFEVSIHIQKEEYYIFKEKRYKKYFKNIDNKIKIKYLFRAYLPKIYLYLKYIKDKGRDNNE